uniref:ABC transporter domain-containing protein n=1 Tax=Globodera pallida TaxID=36090 RepID=A0A183C829_GLOPA
MAHLGGQNSLPDAHPPAQIQQNSFLQQTALNSHPPVVSNNNPFGIKEVRPFQPNDAIDSHKKGKNTSRKLKENVKLQRQIRKSKKVPQRGRIGVILFYVFMLINMFVPHVPQNVMIRYNNHFVPIEKEFVACQPLANAAGYQCEFSLDEMMLESNKTNVEFWANFGEDNDGTLRLLGQQDASKCNADEDGQAHCDTKLVINSDQIDQLKSMSMAEVNDAILKSNKDTELKSMSMAEVNDAILKSNKDTEVHRRKLDEGYVTFWMYNQCGKDLMVGGTAPGTVFNNGISKALISATITSGRIWFNKDCDNDEVKHYCNSGAAQPPISLFEMTLSIDAQFYDVSYVDGINLPISVLVKDCPGVHFANNFTFNSLLASLPDEMKLTYNNGRDLVGVQSVCSAYGTDAVCCRNAYGGPGTCKPDEGHGWTLEQITAYNATRKAFPDAYSYAYDDKTAIKQCKTATEFHIGICTDLKFQ